MGNNKVNEKNSTASNHNLVGHRIDGGRLEFMSVLGLGAYGVVYLARGQCLFPFDDSCISYRVLTRCLAL